MSLFRAVVTEQASPGSASPASRRFLRFLLVGVMNTLVGYSLFYLLLAATSRPIVSVALSTALGALFNFRSIGFLVFGSSEPRLVFRFLCVYAALFLSNTAALDMFRSSGVTPAVAQAVLVGPLAVLSYLLNASLVFRNCPKHARYRKGR